MTDNTLYYGDNLNILRRYVRDETVDLVYLDPPFNSKRDYNLLFKTPTGHESDAQVTAFVDSWHWGEQAEGEFAEVLHQSNTQVAEMMRAFRAFLGENDVMAYLTMMANRLLELRRVMKPTASIYLHCDPTASRYLNILMDAVFGVVNFRNEIIWKRTSAHNDSGVFGKTHDIILYYSKSLTFTQNKQFQTYDTEYTDTHYHFVDEKGRRFRTSDLTAGGLSGGGYEYEWNGVTRIWRCPIERMQQWAAEGRIRYTKNGTAEYIRYLDEMPGMPVQDVWSDIPPINARAAERLGYPTQKPLALLERIINASSNPGDLVLDPFCGCGTAVHAAQALGRKWLGIDITHLAVALIEKRLLDAFPGIAFTVEGTPKDLAAAHDLAQRNKYQFQWWACSLVKAQPYQGGKKGADSGVDGLIYFQDDATGAKKIVVSVKGGGTVGVAMIRELRTTLENQHAEIGLFITLAPPTANMIAEAASAGWYASPTSDVHFPKLQILTIEGLLTGTEAPRYPDLSRGGLTFKKAPKDVPREGKAHKGLYENE